MIKKKGSMWEVIARSGRRMGSYKSRQAALKRLRQIEYFKHKKGVK